MFSSNTSQVASDATVFVEDVFSTFLYTGNSSTQTINNGIDLAGKGGLVWVKPRSASGSNLLRDTARGGNKLLVTDTNDAESTTDSYPIGNGLQFNNNGFSLGPGGAQNFNNFTFASWTLREQAKFFDVVTYTGDGVAGRTVAHSLGSVPGCIIVKRTDAANGWPVYHRAMDATPQNYQMRLNADIAKFTTSPVSRWNNTAPTSTVFTLSDNDEVNGNGATYVAYLFAHDAGGFGLTGTDNVISCGSFTTDGSGNATVNLGYEPQWMLLKRSDAASDWSIQDNMRGWTVGNSSGNNVQLLYPNSSVAENGGGTGSADPKITNTGFTVASYGASRTYIYIAIRRGPMKTPTTGTSVYTGITRTGTGANATVTGAGFPVDLLLSGSRNAAFGTIDFDRLRGATQRLFTYSTAAEAARSTSLTSFAVQDGYTIGDDATDGGLNNSGQTYIYWNFRRAPGFFDVVCYTGTGSNRTVNHNLGVVPELMIFKRRDSAGAWNVWNTYIASLDAANVMQLESTDAVGPVASVFNSTSPTSSVFSLGTAARSNASGGTFVAYLFASCPGVSKVGSYTGNGSSQTINCGFTGGARFVMVKRTDSTGNWMVVDTARGLVSASDPTLYLNSTAAEVTGVDWLDPDNSGFIVNQESTMNANVNGATYIYLSIA